MSPLVSGLIQIALTSNPQTHHLDEVMRLNISSAVSMLYYVTLASSITFMTCPRLGRSMSAQQELHRTDRMTNCVDPDEMASPRANSSGSMLFANIS